MAIFAFWQKCQFFPKMPFLAVFWGCKGAPLPHFPDFGTFWHPRDQFFDPFLTFFSLLSSSPELSGEVFPFFEHRDFGPLKSWCHKCVIFVILDDFWPFLTIFWHFFWPLFLSFFVIFSLFLAVISNKRDFFCRKNAIFFRIFWLFLSIFWHFFDPFFRRFFVIFRLFLPLIFKST